MNHKVSADTWLAEAKRYARHAYCYEGMVEEFALHFEGALAAGDSPYDAVERFGEKYDLDRADEAYGLNSGQLFERHAAWAKEQAS